MGMFIGPAIMFCLTLIPLDMGNYCTSHSITCFLSDDVS